MSKIWVVEMKRSDSDWQPWLAVSSESRKTAIVNLRGARSLDPKNRVYRTLYRLKLYKRV